MDVRSLLPAAVAALLVLLAAPAAATTDLPGDEPTCRLVSGPPTEPTVDLDCVDVWTEYVESAPSLLLWTSSGGEEPPECFPFDVVIDDDPVEVYLDPRPGCMELWRQYVISLIQPQPEPLGPGA